MVHYPPLGRRGSAFSTRAAGYGAFGGAGHTQRSNDGIGFIAMIETPEAIAAAAEIAAVDGVDAVFIGPNDLAHAMGHGSDWNAAPVQRAIELGLKAIAGAGKCPGIIALTPEDEEKYGALGARYFANVSTSIITRALAQAASAGRDAQLRY
ncbi:2-keto-3-deoxy-L-rhamnonate aldolase [compost metagenome]